MPINFVKSSSDWLTSDSILNPPVESGTVTMWIKPSDATFSSILGTGAQWRIKLSGGKFVSNLASVGDLINTTTLSTGVWHHGAFTYVVSNPKLREIYYNGTLEKTDTNVSIVSNDFISLGRSTESTSFLYDGSIFDVRIYDRRLSSGEISSIFNARGSDNIFSGLIHRWALNELSTGVVPLTSGSVRDTVGGLHLTRNNIPTYEEGPFSTNGGEILNG